MSNNAVILTNISLVLLIVLLLLNIAFLAGLPIKKYLWGGRYQKVTPALFVGTVFAIILITFAFVFLWAKVSFGKFEGDQFISYGLAFIFLISFVMNLFSRTLVEKLFGTTVALILSFRFFTP